MIVMKFGGKSLANAECIRNAGWLIGEHSSQQPIVVLSALGNTTDLLLQAAQSKTGGKTHLSEVVNLHCQTCRELSLSEAVVNPLLMELELLLRGIALLQELTPRTRDAVISIGERLSIEITAAYLNQEGLTAKAIEAWNAGILTTSQHGSAEVLPESYAQLRETLHPLIEQGVIPIIPGFIGKDHQGNITTLGRGGSDLTASVVGAALDVSAILLWKDVDGILTGDPRRVEGVRPIEYLSFEEAAELAFFGAKVLHPTSILPAMQANTVVSIRNAFDPSKPGTRIGANHTASHRLITAITAKSSQALVDIVSTRMLGQAGFLGKVFQVFGELQLSVDVIATSEVSVSLTVSPSPQLEKLRLALKPYADVSVQPNMTILNLIGDTRRSSQLLRTALDVLCDQQVEVHMISHGASKVTTSLIIKDSDTTRCLQRLHDLCIEDI